MLNCLSSTPYEAMKVMDQSAMDLKFVDVCKASKLYESAIFLEPETVRAALALGDCHVGECQNKDAIYLEDI